MRKARQIAPYHRYIAHIIGKYALESGGIALLLCSLLITFVTFAFGLVTIVCLLNGPEWLLFSVFGGITLFGALCSWLMFRSGVAASNLSHRIEPLLPPTRHNIEGLPANEILLRASNEQETQPEQILLRPAAASDATPQEELLRPHG